ncbi:hypothetical protein FJZ33_04465 [Candidatus Poribacteria bacterium]|nr:hypothetical protein [Candidatus Poribacteria bacterium]
MKSFFYIIYAPILIFLIFVVSGCDDILFGNSGFTEEERKAYKIQQKSLNWSPDGTMLSYIYLSKILIRDFDTGKVRELTGTGLYETPTWSPDSKKIAYVLSSSKTRPGIWIKDVDGTGVAKLITSSKTSDYRPRWSYDGTKIAFHSRRLNNLDIWIRNADGSGEDIAVASDPAVDQNAEWSPDSTRLAFESRRSGNMDIWVSRIDGSSPPIQITKDSASDTYPVWSPDGTKIAFQSTRSGSKGIWVVNSDGTGPSIELSSELKNVDMQSWSSDSKRLAFVSAEVIYIKNADGTGEAIKFAEGLEPKWSPDGTKISYIGLLEGQYKILILDIPSEFR